MQSRRLAALFVTLIVCGSVVGILVPAGLGWDFANFYDAGRRILAGQAGDLYHPAREIAGAPPQGLLAFFGAPLSAFFYAPLGWFRPGTALVLFKLENVAALGAAFWLLLSFYRRFVPADEGSQARFTALFLGLCLVFQPFWTVFRVGGQTTPTVFLLIAMAVVLQTRSRLWESVVCLAVATLIKPAFAPAFAFIALVSGMPFFWRAGAVSAVAAAVSFAALGPAVHFDFVARMRANGALTYPWFYNSSLFILIDAVRGSSEPTGTAALMFQLAKTGLQLGVIGFVVWLWASARRLSLSAPARVHFNLMLAILLFLLSSRTVWEHYLSLLFIPLVYVVASRERFDPRASAMIGAIFGLSVFQNLIFVMWLREQAVAAPPLALFAIALLKSAPLLLTLLFLIRYRGELFASYSAHPWYRA